MRRVLRALQVIPRALYKGGGLAGMVARIWEIFRASGFSGVGRSLGILIRGEGPPRAEERANYAAWIARYDAMTEPRREALRRRIERLQRRPGISVVMPVASADAARWREAVESVRRQLYPHWSLYLVCDRAEPDALAAATELAAAEPRVHVLAAASADGVQGLNLALADADGAWTLFLTADDLLPEQAFFWLADSIDREPEPRLIYADEDLIDERGLRSKPDFKPDWNIDLLRSRHYLGRFVAFDTALLREVGGIATDRRGAWAYDLVLRCSECISASQVHHVPRVLLHHRACTAEVGVEDEGRQEAGRALTAHLQRTGVMGHVTGIPCGHRVTYALPDPAPLVSLVIPTRNAAALVRTCIDSIRRLTLYPRYEILLVDNGSDDPEALTCFRQLDAQPGVRVIRDDREFNYSALNNAAVALAEGELIALINNDIEIISPDWLSEMVGIALQPGVGAVGARLWYPDRTLQHGGVILAGAAGIAAHLHRGLPAGEPGYFGRAVLSQTLSAVTAACLVIRKSTYQSLGGLDEANLKVAFNDVDFCLRLREAGYRNVWTPHAELFHYESATRGEDLSPEKKARFEAEVAHMARRWGAALDQDPAYNPNLTFHFDDFSFAWPPRLAVFD